MEPTNIKGLDHEALGGVWGEFVLQHITMEEYRDLSNMARRQAMREMIYRQPTPEGVDEARTFLNIWVASIPLADEMVWNGVMVGILQPGG